MTTIRRSHWTIEAALLVILLVACGTPIAKTTPTVIPTATRKPARSPEATPTKDIAVQRPQTPTPISVQGIGSPADIGVCILTLRNIGTEQELQGTSLARGQVSPFMKYTPKQDDAVFLVAVLGSSCGPIYANGLNARLDTADAISYVPALYGLQCGDILDDMYFSEDIAYLMDAPCNMSDLHMIFIIPTTAATQELLISIQVHWLGEGNALMSQEVQFKVSVKP